MAVSQSARAQPETTRMTVGAWLRRHCSEEATLNKKLLYCGPLVDRLRVLCSASDSGILD